MMMMSYCARGTLPLHFDSRTADGMSKIQSWTVGVHFSFISFFPFLLRWPTSRRAGGAEKGGVQRL